MIDFESLWRWVMDRSSHGVMTVQERSELEHVFNIMRDCQCESYLEVGSAEGNSLYVLGHIPDHIEYIDLGEPHTKSARDEAIDRLGKDVCEFFGDSTRPETHHRMSQYDCILIDGGHDFATVLSDCIMYASLAKKYVFFHDVQLPEVKAAVEWFCKRWKLGSYSTFINSPTFGYGILKIG